MRVAYHTTFVAAKKESLAEMCGRVRQGFLDAQLGEPIVRFTFIDSALAAAKGRSPVDLAVRRHPQMDRFLISAQVLPGPGHKETLQISNAATGEQADYATVHTIMTGVPRSYPFSGVWIHFYAPVFGEALRGLPKLGKSFPGIVVTDNWWVTGRSRALSAYTVFEVEEAAKKLPPHPEAVAAVLRACGKTRGTVQVPILAPGGRTVVGSVPQASIEAVNAIVAAHRARLADIVERAAMPHDLPAPAAGVREQSVGIVAGPRKPVLEAVFRPMGYSCRGGGAGELHVTRKTAANLTVELYLDVGTWSHEVSAVFQAQGAGFRASLPIPVTPQDASCSQYPIGDAEQWRKIVENLAAVVRELDRSLVPEIEAAAGPTPAWYQPAL
ncbi:MAG TPA: hypothetical protein VGL53_31895 [Bryobacteraceae bacterium]|jgi:hypothetical protein